LNLKLRDSQKFSVSKAAKNKQKIINQQITKTVEYFFLKISPKNMIIIFADFLLITLSCSKSYPFCLSLKLFINSIQLSIFTHAVSVENFVFILYFSHANIIFLRFITIVGEGI
jgi:hypothetical protein